jgi:hypothetical protein
VEHAFAICSECGVTRLGTSERRPPPARSSTPISYAIFNPLAIVKLAGCRTAMSTRTKTWVCIMF